MRKLILSLLLPTLLMIGCAGSPKSEALPRFPAPTTEAIDALEQCQSPAIDSWIEDLAKLCQKLEGDC